MTIIDLSSMINLLLQKLKLKARKKDFGQIKQTNLILFVFKNSREMLNVPSNFFPIYSVRSVLMD